MTRVILDLCAGSGAWSQPYVEAGYDVRRYDLPTDVRLLRVHSGPVHGIWTEEPSLGSKNTANEAPNFGNSSSPPRRLGR